MKYGISILIFFVYSICLFPTEVTEIYTVEEPPSSYTVISGELAGYSVDIVREIQKIIGSKVQIKIVPEIRAILKANNDPNIVIFSFSRTSEREDLYFWIKKVIVKSWVFYSLNESKISINSIDDARNLDSIGVIRGDVRAYYLEKLGFTNLVYISRPELGIRMLKNGRIQTLFYESLGFIYYCKNEEYPFSDFKNLLEPFSSDVYIIMSKNGTDPGLLKEWINAALKLEMDGTLKQISKKWYDIILKEYGIMTLIENDILKF